MAEKWREMVGRSHTAEDLVSDDMTSKLYHGCNGKPSEYFSRGET